MTIVYPNISKVTGLGLKEKENEKTLHTDPHDINFVLHLLLTTAILRSAPMLETTLVPSPLRLLLFQV